MKKPKHTPGPWTAETNGDTHPKVLGLDGKTIMGTAQAKTRLYAENCANVRLAALAPELLAGLREAIEFMPDNLLKAELLVLVARSGD